jgi:hypothetical protein
MQSDEENGYLGGKLGDFWDCYGVKILTVTQKSGKLMGRAIYWPHVNGGGVDGPALDRMYGSPEAVEMMKNYATENALAYKLQQSMGSREWQRNGERVGSGGYVESAKSVSSHIYYPYMDTFAYGDDDDTLNTQKDDDTTHEYKSTSGGREEINPHEGQVQLANGEWIDEDDAYEVDGEYYGSDEVVYCHRSGETILRDGAFMVELSRYETIYLSADYVTEL